jgi:hypothetical protein
VPTQYIDNEEKSKAAIMKNCSFFLYLSNKKMSTKYKATTTEEAYFITITTVGWVDVFTQLNQKYNIINS